jgi:hypothetical protein
MTAKKNLNKIDSDDGARNSREEETFSRERAASLEDQAELRGDQPGHLFLNDKVRLGSNLVMHFSRVI